MITPEIVAVVAIAALLVLFLLRVPVGLALMLVAVCGIALIRPKAALPKLAGDIFGEATHFPLIVIPLFVLMGNLASLSGMSRDLFRAANDWLGHLKGGLASATIACCAGFSAVSGSSLATAITVGRVGLPEMRRHGYSDSLATGSIAAGGTLGILIPPSSGFVIYAILTEQSIGRLFIAGVLPGVLMTLLFLLALRLRISLSPSAAPLPQPKAPLAQRLRSIAGAGWFIALFGVTIGGIYGGFFTAVEASAVGACFAFLVAAVRRRLTWRSLLQVAQDTLQVTGTVFLVLFGAFAFKSLIGFSGIAHDFAQWIATHDLSGAQVVLIALAVFILLGSMLEGLAILVLAIPLLQPILAQHGVDMVWFGVLVVITLEIGLISPPIGMNVFAVKSIAPNVPLSSIYRGVWPYWWAMLATALLIFLMPSIALMLPNSMIGVR
jgi:tripartite ATP-independent transporter DctM subunit